MELEDEWDSLQSDIIKRALQHPDRVALIRPVQFEVAGPVNFSPIPIGPRRAWTINVSNGGLCLLTGTPQAPETILRLSRPCPDLPEGPQTLAEVRWLRGLPAETVMYLMGVKFVP
jgi:hypothetical protein